LEYRDGRYYLTEAGMKAELNRFLREDQGQDLTEYTLLIVFVLLAMISLAVGLGNSVEGIVSASDARLAAANTAVATGSPVF
jgi:Flp pilus assembly pilin Flp